MAVSGEALINLNEKDAPKNRGKEAPAVTLRLHRDSF